MMVIQNLNTNTANLLKSFRRGAAYGYTRPGKVSDAQLETILEAGRWAPSGANTQPWEVIVTRDRKKMKGIRAIYDNEWKQRKREDPVNYKGLKKDYVGDVSVILLVCGDTRTKQMYLTTRQPGVIAKSSFRRASATPCSR